MATDPNTITVCYPSGADLRHFHKHFVALVDGAALPEALVDLVTADVVRDGDRTIVRVEFA